MSPREEFVLAKRGQERGKAITPHHFIWHVIFFIARKVITTPPLVMEPACQAFLLLNKRLFVKPRTFVQAVEDFRFMPHLRHPLRARVL